MKSTQLPVVLLVFLIIINSCTSPTKEQSFKLEDINTFYKAAPTNVETRWITSENKQGEKGKGGMTNKGAKGDAFTVIGPGDTLTIFEQHGSGIINKIWVANSFGWDQRNRRAISINMYWDGAKKPAVSVPFTDFFGIGLGLMRPMESALFTQPEGRSFNSYVPMPFRTSGKIDIVNESDTFLMFYYEVDFLKVPKLDDDAMYFHAYWNRDTSTTKGVDYTVLPKVTGRGRYMGANFGVIGNPVYQGTWFGEGEVKAFIDGDDKFATLVGTGTEDYIGTGWGQGEYSNLTQGSPVSNDSLDYYAFYRYHTSDPVYFHKECKVTIQQIGNAKKKKIIEMINDGVEIDPIWSFMPDDGYKAAKRYFDLPPISRDSLINGLSDLSNNFYRDNDDVSATAYFYLDKPVSTLPGLPSLEIRMKGTEHMYLQLGEIEKEIVSE